MATDSKANKSANALKMLNFMMEATGSSMDECRAMLSSCDGDPNKCVSAGASQRVCQAAIDSLGPLFTDLKLCVRRSRRATEQLLANPFQKVASKPKHKLEEKRPEGAPGRGSAGRGGYAGGRGRGSGARGYGDQHGSRDQQESKGYRGSEGRGYSGRGGRGGQNGAAKAHDTNGHSAPIPATDPQSPRPNDAATYSASFPAAVSSAAPAQGTATSGSTTTPAPATNGWGPAAGTGKTFAERLKANISKREESKSPARAAQPTASAASAPAAAPEPAADEYHVDEYYVADETTAHAEEVADSVDASDQITQPPAPAYQAPAWNADAGKLIMSSLKSSTTPQPAPEETLSASDNPVAPPNAATHQYSAFPPAPAVSAPAEHKPAPEADTSGLQLAFGTFGIGGGGLGDFGAQFSVQSAYPQTTAAADSLLKPQAPQTVQPAQPAAPQPPVAPQPAAAPSPPAMPAYQAPVQQDSVLQSNALDQYKAYSGYGLQANLGGDKITPPPAATTTDASRAAQVPGMGYNQAFSQPPYGGFAAFGHDMSQPAYTAVAQAFSHDYPDPHKAAAAAAYTAPSAGLNAGYGAAPGYGAQSAAPPASAAYNQNVGKYTPPYAQTGAVGTAQAAAPAAPAAPASTASSEATSQAPASGTAGAQAAGAGVPQAQQSVYGNAAAAPGGIAPPLPYGGYGMYPGYGAQANQQSLYAAMYAANQAAYSYPAPYSQVSRFAHWVLRTA